MITNKTVTFQDYEAALEFYNMFRKETNYLVYEPILRTYTNQFRGLEYYEVIISKLGETP